MTRVIESFHLEPQTGTGFVLHKGQSVTVVDPKGGQVADLLSFRLGDTELHNLGTEDKAVYKADSTEYLSSGRSIDFNDTIFMTTGATLYSNQGRPMFVITEDSVGKHDFLYTPCGPSTFKIIYHLDKYHPSCLENLYLGLKLFGLHEHQISITTFNIFMNVDILEGGATRFSPPLSKAGDFIVLRAEMDMVVAVAACSSEICNDYMFSPIDVFIRE